MSLERMRNELIQRARETCDQLHVGQELEELQLGLIEPPTEAPPAAPAPRGIVVIDLS